VSSAGFALLAIAALAGFAGLLLPLLSRVLHRAVLARAGMWAADLVLLATIAAMALLLAAFLARDFGNLYVYEHSSRALSGIYTVSALWAGNAGSLLLWLLLMAVFTVVASRGGRGRDPESAPYLAAVLSAITFFFALIVLFGPGCNPFAANPIEPAPADGLGLNPMLKNPGMIIHPVALYLGYVAMAVPFALMIAGLAAGSSMRTWLGAVRRWTIIGWLFLTIGNVVGAWWAYVTLGWGGYWAWDPVENASLIPWLTATALLHAAITAQRRRRLMAWTASLAAVTFLLTIFGTFLTRAGIAESVHAFEDSGLVPWFTVFLVIMLALSLAVIVKRAGSLKHEGPAAPLFGEASNLLYTAGLLSVMTFFILWGVIFPPIANSLGTSQVVLGQGFFNAVTAPLGLVLIALLVLCTLQSPVARASRRLTVDLGVSAAVAVVVLVVLLAAGVRKPYPVAAFVLSAMAVSAVMLMFVRDPRNRRRYGSMLVHLGLLILVIGLAGSWAYKESVEGQLAPGEKLTLGEVQVTYEDLRTQAVNNTDKSVTQAVLQLAVDGRSKGEMRPSLEYYPASDQVWTRVARHTSASGDVYVSLLALETDGKTISLRLESHPLIVWLWIGGAVMTLGGIVALWAMRSRRRGAPATEVLPAEAPATDA
jgi:cytochrome c-type biogenesis protein CcmF